MEHPTGLFTQTQGCSTYRISVDLSRRSTLRSRNTLVAMTSGLVTSGLVLLEHPADFLLNKAAQDGGWFDDPHQLVLKATYITNQN
ncbi:hypothetical protein ACROYT_G006215 [Oculina patagonica]